MNKKKFSLLLTSLLTLSMVIPVVFADGVIDTERFTAIGNYGIVAGGIGLDAVDSGDITVNVPGDSVIAAYLYWAGFDYMNEGDDEVLFDGNTIEADQTYTDLWLEDPITEEDDKWHYVYVADVTTFVNLGSDTYTVAEFQLGDAPDSREYGAELIVVYEDDTLPLANVTILDGLDSYYWNFPDPRGPNSEIFSIDLEPNLANNDVEMILFAGGTGSPDDPNNILIDTGAGALPSPTITDPIAPVDSLTADDGLMWDTYQRTIQTEPGDEWICAQIESIPEDGASGLLIGAGFVQQISTDFEGLTPGFWKNHPDCWYSYDPDDEFDEVFGVSVTINAQGKKPGNSDPTLMEALNAKGGVNVAKGEYGALVRHAVAALLNADRPEVNYPWSESDIIDAVADAINGERDAGELKDMLDTFNNAGGGIDAHCNPI